MGNVGGENWEFHKSPAAVELSSFKRTPIYRPVRGQHPERKSDWSWVFPKGPKNFDLKQMGEIDVHPGEPASGINRHFSSPSTLTYEGQREASRVLGSNAHFPPPGGYSKRVVKEEPPLPPRNKVPQTCMQLLGSRAHMADWKDRRYIPKSSCEAVLFVDQANKSNTPYDPSIRF